VNAPTTDELHPSTNVVLFSPAWSARPVFHRLGYHFDDDASPAHLERLEVPEGFDVTVVSTPCGSIVRANWWLEPRNRGIPTFSATYEHPFSIVELRLDQAASFGRPCRRCFDVPAADDVGPPS